MEYGDLWGSSLTVLPGDLQCDRLWVCLLARASHGSQTDGNKEDTLGVWMLGEGGSTGQSITLSLV